MGVRVCVLHWAWMNVYVGGSCWCGLECIFC